MIMFYLRRNLKRCQYMQNFMSSASAVASSRCWILQNGLSVCLFWLDSPPVGQGLLIHEVLCRPLPLYFRRGAGYCKEVCLFVYLFVCLFVSVYYMSYVRLYYLFIRFNYFHLSLSLRAAAEI